MGKRLLDLCLIECTRLRTHEHPKTNFGRKFNRTGMADTSVVYFYPDLVGFWRSNLDILDGEFFPTLPRNRGLLSVSYALEKKVSGFCAYFAGDSLSV